MANENEKNPSALEELRQLKRTDRIKSLDIHEPELKGFNAENIFHIDEEPEKKTLFGKRSAKTHVKINENIFDDEVSESVDITPNTSIEEVEAPIEKHTVEPVMGPPLGEVPSALTGRRGPSLKYPETPGSVSR